jgi:hypothetical protein
MRLLVVLALLASTFNESPTNGASSDDIAVMQLAIASVVQGSFWGRDNQTPVAAVRARSEAPSFFFFDFALNDRVLRDKLNAAGITSRTINALRNANAQPIGLPERVVAGQALIDARKFDAVTKRYGRDTYDHLDEFRSDVIGLVTVSRPAYFSHPRLGTAALVYAHRSRGPRYGEGWLFILQPKDGKWTVAWSRAILAN